MIELPKLPKPSSVFTVDGMIGSKLFHLPDGKYLEFVVPQIMGPTFAEDLKVKHPDRIIVAVPSTQSIDEAIWHYEVRNAKLLLGSSH